MKIYIAIDIVNIYEYLGCIPDACHCLEGMPLPYYCKVCYRVQFKKVGTCDCKKVSDHEIGRPR